MNPKTKHLIEERRRKAERLIQESTESAQRLDAARMNAARYSGEANATLNQIAEQLDKVAKKS